MWGSALGLAIGWTKAVGARCIDAEGYAGADAVEAEPRLDGRGGRNERYTCG